MAKTYTTISGDTYAKIARKMYGDESKASLISQSNPGITSITAGKSLTIPDDPDGIASGTANAKASEPNEVAMTVNATRFRFWNEINITKSIDNQDIIDFTAPFEPDNDSHREFFRPFKFQDVTIDVAGLRFFTGTMVAPNPSMDVDSRTISVSCYSKAGVLNDCTAPASAYPLEWSGATLKTIAVKLCSLFGIGVVFDQDPGATFKKVALRPGQKVMDFLADLASQRQFTIGATSAGKIRFAREDDTPGTAKASLTMGESPLISIRPQFNPQDYYSSITGIAPVTVSDTDDDDIGVVGSYANTTSSSKTGGGARYTVTNPRLTGVIRPYTFKVPDAKNNDLKTSVTTKAGRMFANAASYEVELATWRDQFGDLWEPGTYVSLYAPGVMVYSRYTFMIREVRFKKSPDSESATLNLIIPGSLSGTMPGSLPWDE